MERSTNQRRVIRKVLDEAERPLGPQEILEAAQSHLPTLGIATVYRTLKGFLEDGTVAPVELPGESLRYETSGKPHHHHFRCRECNRVFELEGCEVQTRGLAPPGFKVDAHELVLYGACKECRRAAR
ncbi:MAG: transcriptional repressor [Armatimonadetes bacterium]|nr:transcriptional repressor [Armatimonadota bacterium]